jgi:pimeloyl-ACP methyl ester carboxylesterase
MPMRSSQVLGLSARGFHHMRYVEWGDPANPRVLICVHGLTRNGRDFDEFARSLEDHYRILCPDVVGRGRSDWLTDKAGYAYPQYLADMTVLIARSGAERIDWVGTSMGGLIGMLLAAQPHTPIRKLVVNDVGPFIPREALGRIAQYVGQAPDFANLDEMERYIRTVSAPFGPLSDAQWRHLTVHAARQRADGRVEFAYDPGIAEPFRDAARGNVDLWPVWEQLRCPVLILRGVDSDLLRHEDALAMTRRGPRAELVEFAGIGHAPMLMAPDQIAAVRDWLLADRDRSGAG